MKALLQSCWPAAPSGSGEDLTIGDLLRSRAETWPDALALEEIALSGEAGRRWTHSQLRSDAELGRALAIRHPTA